MNKIKNLTGLSPDRGHQPRGCMFQPPRVCEFDLHLGSTRDPQRAARSPLQTLGIHGTGSMLHHTLKNMPPPPCWSTAIM